MNKSELVKAIAEKTGLKKKDTALFIEGLEDVVVSTLLSNDRISLVGFGTFDVKEVKEREGVNPATGERIVIPASLRPGFKFSPSVKKAFKDKE